MEIDEDFVYVTNSLRRMDIVYFLNSVDFAKSDELSAVLLLPMSSLYPILKNLRQRDIIDWQKVGNVNIYALTNKGKQIVQKLKEYHGID